MEVNAINIAQKAIADKTKKRTNQLREVESKVKAREEELKKIQKELDVKKVKNLYKAYNTNTSDKVKQLVEALVGVLKNKTNVSIQDVDVRLYRQQDR